MQPEASYWDYWEAPNFWKTDPAYPKITPIHPRAA